MNLRADLGPGVSSVDSVRSALRLIRPVSVRTMMRRYREPIVIDEPLSTPGGVALGGHHTITLERNGRFRHQGHMRATGFPSYTFGVRTLVNAADAPTVLAAGGSVHGTNEVGDRESSWDQSGDNPLLTLHWAALKQATASTQITYDTDWFGDVIGFIGLLIAGSALAGRAGVYIVLGFEAADAAGVDQGLGMTGLAGVGVAAGVLVVLGPGAIVPAIAVGAAAGVAVELTVKHRRMSDEEKRFADQVFAGTLPTNRIVLTNLLGLGRRPFTIPSAGDTILVNLGAGYDDPVRYTGKGDPQRNIVQAAGQLFIHELTHAWQIDTSKFLPGMMCEAVVNQSTTIGGNMSIYKYGAAGPPFSTFNLEQQANIVDDWFGGSAPQPGARVENDSNPYFRYIRDNIRSRTP